MGCNRFAGAGVYHRAKSVIFLELFDHIYFVVFKGLVIELFFLTYKGVRFFPALHAMIGIFSVLACEAGAWK